MSQDEAETSPNRPTRLSPASVLLWRSAQSIQLELGHDRIAVDGVTSELIKSLLSGEDGTDSEHAAASGELRAELVRRGFLWTPAPDSTPAYPYLAHELTALEARRGPAAGTTLRGRNECSVVVQGTGRAGPLVAAILAASGVGRVHVLDRGPTHLAQTVPGGATASDEGTPFSDAAAAAIHRVAPRADTSAPPFGDRPDLVLLAVDEPVDSDCRDALHARRCAHLVIRLTPSSGIVGPFVLPGLTSCLACADLHRRDRDPGWPALAVQLTIPRRQPVTSEACVAVTLAGVAASQALTYLDGGSPASLEGTLELHPPDWRLRRRTWPAHTDCDCMTRNAAQ